MKNERGIFILMVLKKMRDKFMYFNNYDGIDKNMSDSNVGSRKGRNIKDHLLILHGVINSVIRGNAECIDIQVYDLEQAFDSLWLQDCLNDVFDTLPIENRNDKLSLLHESSQTNLVAVNTPAGLTDRANLPNIVQQGGTWGSLLCSNTVDTIGKKCRNRAEHFYLYKNVVRILPLAFVDDLNAISKCGLESISLNTFITTQIELKRLKFHVPDAVGKSKCHKMHIGRRDTLCPTLKVHGTVMQEVSEETYLGDIVSCDGKNTKNIKDRISKGVGIITQILNLLEMISFGPFLFEIALLLRESMLINGTMTNAEVWYNVSDSEVREFENLDKLFFKKLLGVPNSTPGEAYCLEFGVLPLGVILKARRINYLHSILKGDKNGMLYSFFIVQWHNPSKGDWTELVKVDLVDFKIEASFENIQNKSKDSFKRMVKTKAREYALKILLEKKFHHSKMENVNYNELKIQNYLMDENLSTNEMKTVFKYRTRMEKFGENYRGGKSQVICPLCSLHLDNQSLSFQCPIIKEKLNITGEMEDIYKENIKVETIKAVCKISDYRNQADTNN